MPSADPAYAVQKGVYTALTTHADMQAFFDQWSDGKVRVYDRVPADAASGRITAKFPYCTIGEDQIIGETNQNTDGSEVFVKVDCWSRPASGSKLEVKAMAGAVRTALCRDFDLEGHGIVAQEHTSTMYRREPDGLTERAIVTVRLKTSPIWKSLY